MHGQPPHHDLLVPSRFCGPASSGNGGWSAGALAAYAGGPGVVRVTLRRPPPLDTPMPVTDVEGRHVATQGGGAVLEAERVEAELTTVPPVAADEAGAARASYAGLASHPFPTCFSCGTARAEGDGLRIFPGRVADAEDGSVRVASTWTPHPSVADDSPEHAAGQPRASLAVTWAALDCVGGWAGDLAERLMVLGRMTAVVESLPEIGEQHVVVGQDRGHDGRKTFTAATLYDSAGQVVGRAEHVWFAVDPALFS